MTEFTPFPSIARLVRQMVVTEKLDGTNAQVVVGEDGSVVAGSRNRWITPDADNYGFAAWVRDHADELRALGPGRHFGEWWGAGIQRRYGLTEKRFSLFNVGRWTTSVGEVTDKRALVPVCCHVVPVLYEGVFCTSAVDTQCQRLAVLGSVAAPGFMQPEGVVVFHAASSQLFKRTLDKNDGHKSAA